MSACALAAVLGCSSAGQGGTGDRPAALPAPPAGEPAVVSPGASPVAPGLAPAGRTPPPVAPAPASGGSRGAPRAGELQLLGQLVTAQALLVSLLLAPVSKRPEGGPLARVDSPPPP